MVKSKYVKKDASLSDPSIETCSCGGQKIVVYITNKMKPVCEKCWIKLAKSNKEW
jgi:hypothetical protein